jgi:anti-sigma factor RsiW
MTTPAPDHATHDPLLIAAHLDGTLDARERTRVHDWLTGCSACSTLRADLVTLAAATHDLPMPRRPRHFTLTEADAQRATSRGWRRVLGAIASPRDRFTRPLALGLTTMGLAGLLIANVPSTGIFSSASSAGAAAPEIQMTESDAGASQELAPAVGPLAGSSSLPGDTAAEPTGREGVGNDGGEVGRGSAKGSVLEQFTAPGADGGPSLLILLSALMLVTGLTLVLLRWGARRLGDG